MLCILNNKQVDRFIIQQSKKNPNYWVCTDRLNGIVCVFEEHNFNDNQKFTILEDVAAPDVQRLAELGGEMADWLRDDHYDKIF